MTLAFYMDVQVHRSITNGLRARGVDVLTAQEDGFDEAPDRWVLNRAASLGRVLVTYDQDFLAEAHERQQIGIEFTGVVFSHQAQVDPGRWINDLELLAACIEPDEIRDRVEYLPLR